MPERKGFFSKFQAFDAYAKTMDDFKVKTYSGAFLTLASIITVLVLIFNEYSLYANVVKSSELVIDKERTEKMKINLDITFHSAPCNLLGLDVMDSTGEHRINSFEYVQKTRLNKDGTQVTNPISFLPEPPKHENGTLIRDYCGSCYGALKGSECCNTCKAVQEAYRIRGWPFSNPEKIEQCVRERFVEQVQSQKGEGCRIKGSVVINKVTGNFHIMAGETVQIQSMHAHVVHDYFPTDYNFDHTINYLSFGGDFYEQNNPLDKVSKKSLGSPVQYQYFIKVVASETRMLNGKVHKTNQYSVTEYNSGTIAESKSGHAHAKAKPGFFVNFDISPMRIIYYESKKSFSSFLSSSLAIIGSIFTVAGIIDSLIFKAEKAIAHKLEIGKQA
ncbi:hypothetical protein BB560_004499 [Smittium megazygosporum]|uniref:Endoplasmic reticulum vesicle transporter C-terminal domain-containing protein n=1 Tax=Smittium megazygosporum TaxID=133381 RepID=A0A2T9Z994_9FUNG|nr:hypothetical protein BB560_004499 [Smittium megazygosporum]